MAQLRFKDLFKNRVFYMVAPGMGIAEVTVLGHSYAKNDSIWDGTGCINEHAMEHRVRLSANYGEFGDAIFTIGESHIEPSMSNIRMFSKRRQAEAYSKRAEIHVEHCTLLAIQPV